MAEHLENPALDALHIKGEDTHGHKAHMRHRRIGDELFHIILAVSHKRGVNNRDNRHPENDRRKIERRFWEQRN